MNTLEKAPAPSMGVVAEATSAELGRPLDLEPEAEGVSFTERAGRELVPAGLLFATGSTKGVN